MDYTTSAECNQIRVSFTVGRGGWGNDIGAVRVDNAKLTGHHVHTRPNSVL